MDCFHYTTVLFKNPSFSVKYFIKKPFSEMPKGWKLSNSPYWKALELLREILHLKI
jgi:hypothetical protein